MLANLRTFFRYARSNPLTMLGLGWILLLILIAIFASWVAPFPKDDIQCHMKDILQLPTWAHLFGTDEMGRDLFSRIILGSRISLQMGLMVLGLALLIGVPLGVIAGFSGGIVDELIMRVTDVFMSFPALLLAMSISALLGPSLINAMIAIAVAWWPWYTRLLRSEALSIKEKSYVEAARAVGAGDWRIVFKHVLPNSLVPVIIQVSMDFGSVILTAASLSFLGLGAQPPTPEWGLMISTSRNFFLNGWWVITFPGIAILLTVLAFNLLGDALREILDPKMRRIRR